jgi:guanylate kinase
MVIDNNNYKASSLISITNNTLELKNIVSNIQAYKDDNIKVVSILGSARMGKSTLLNTIISKYNNYNNNIFATSKSSDNHCTRGIDFVYVPGLKIVFCDVQGLNHDDSSNDPKLLLISYLMSDIIIFTEPKMLNKNTLQTLSPLASFLTYLDAQQINNNNSQPSLVFRISDFTLSGKPEDNLNKLLFENNDQHKNLIINMKALFKDIKAFKTEQLDRSELKMLDNNNFIGLLESDENGFNGFISELNEYLDKAPSKFNFQKWYTNLAKFIKEINSNNKIDFNKLDIYHQLAKVELLEYKDKIRKTKPELFTAMKVNHTQKDLIFIINMRIKLRDDIDKEFQSKFKVVNDNIKKIHYGELIDDINKHISEALKSNYDQGMKIMTDYTKANFKRVDINQLTLVAKDLDLTESDNYLKSNDINENIVKDYNKWKAQINKCYKDKKNVVIDLQKIEITKYKNKMEEYVSNFVNSIKEYVLLNKTKNIEEINLFLLTSYEKFKEDLNQGHNPKFICNTSQKDLTL